MKGGITPLVTIEYQPPNSDSLTLTAYLPYKIGMKKKSDIIVQRIFKKDEDSTIILKNNYPEFTNLIYNLSKKYSKDYFLAFSKKAKYYFIRYSISSKIEDCGSYEEL
jgi:hypothetical protein